MPTALLSTAVAVGSLAGALVAAKRNVPRHRIIVGAAMAFGLLEVVCGLMPSYAALMVMLVPTGMAALTMSTSVNAYLQLGTSPEVRGRVMALYMMVFLGGSPVGAPIVGWITDTYGARVGFAAGGAVAVAAAAVIGLILLGGITRLDTVRQALERLAPQT